MEKEREREMAKYLVAERYAADWSDVCMPGPFGEGLLYGFIVCVSLAFSESPSLYSLHEYLIGNISGSSSSAECSR